MGLARLRKLRLIKKMLEMFDADNKVKVNDETLVRARDNITKALQSTNSDHTAIHKGYGYCAHLYFEELEHGDKKRYRWKGPEHLYCHIKSIQVGCIGATVSAKIIKDVTITNDGTKEDCLCNLNHNADIPAKSEIYDGNVEYSGGKTWCEVIVRGFTSEETKQAPAQQTAGQFIQNDYIEYVTKNGEEEYIIEIENIDVEENTAFDLTIDLFFYEEPEGIY